MTAKDDREKDEQIARLIAQAEKLVHDLNKTVLTMKVILSAAEVNIQQEKDARDE